jgi:hypothetical protein
MISGSRTNAYSIAIALIFLTACNGTQPFVSSPAMRSGSLMLPEAKSRDLLYVTQASTIDFFSYPGGKLKGEISDEDQPGGECVDASGDIFVPNYLSEDIVEYRHGSTAPFARYKDTGFFPTACSVNPRNGELAVTDRMSVSSSGPGDVAIYKTGNPDPRSRLYDLQLNTMNDCVYDASGNLYIGGIEGSDEIAYAILRSGSPYIVKYTLSPMVGDPGQMQWDGSHLVISDRAKDTLVRYALGERDGTEAGVTKLKEIGANVNAFWVQEGSVLAPLFNKAEVGIWKYPQGGKPTAEIATPNYAGNVIVSSASSLR